MSLDKKEIMKWLRIRLTYLGLVCLAFVVMLLAGGAVATYPARLISFEVFVGLMLVVYGIGILSFPEFFRCYKDLKSEGKTKSIQLFVQPGTGGIQLTKDYSKLSYRSVDRKKVDEFLQGISEKTVTFEYLSNSGLIVNVYISADRRVRRTDTSASGSTTSPQ